MPAIHASTSASIKLPQMVIEFGIQGAARGGQRGDLVIIVDAIRATTTIPVMLSRGAVKVIPCESRAAVEAARAQWPKALRAGERQCRRIEGYDMGSSPSEISPMDLTGAVILHSTTNGTWAVRAALDNGATSVLTGSFATMTPTAAAALDLAQAGVQASASQPGPTPTDTSESKPPGITLVATGRLGKFTAEDWLGCRFVAARIKDLAERLSGKPYSRRELFKAMSSKWQLPMSPQELRKTISDSPSVAAVKEAGLEADIDHCLALDSIAVAPWYDGEGFVDHWRE